MLNSYRYKYIPIIGCLVILSGFLVLIGWQFDIVVLKSLMYNVTAMNPTTALTIIICGTWLFLFSKNERSKLLPVLWLIVLVVGLIHLITFFIPFDGIRMDHLLFTEKNKTSSLPSMIAPTTALIFICSGVSMATVSAKLRWILAVRQVLMVIIFCIAYISVVGYCYDVQTIHHLYGFSQMAFPTALTLLLFNIGLLISNTDYGLSSMLATTLDGSILLRRGSIFMFALPPLLGYLISLCEKKGLFSIAFGDEIFTLAFTIVVFISIILYASQLNKKQQANRILEMQLAANEQKFRTLVNSLKEGVASIDYDGKILYCNPSYCNIVGYSEQELVGQVVVDTIIPVSRRPEFYKRLEDRKKGLVENYETEIFRKNGEKIIIDIKSRTLYDESRKPYAYVMSINDITEEKRKIEDLKAFSASAAHDLNAPLSRIEMIIDILDKENLNEEQKTHLSMIVLTATNMRQLLKDLLTFSKLGTTQLEKTDTNLDEIAADICKELTPDNFNGRIILHHLPPVIGNKSAIKQLFTNLISNAIKYSSNNPAPQIEIGAANRHAQIVYYVKDNGVGLSADQVNSLFTPFKRFHSDFEGNGLGLAIVKRVIEKHGGAISVDSEPGMGTTFSFTLLPDTKIN